MALTETRPETTGSSEPAPTRPAPGPLERLVGTGDHTSIGRLFIGLALMLTIVSLAGRALAGVDLLADGSVLDGRAAMLAPSSVVGLALTGVVPLLLGLVLVVVPLQLGAPAVAFPRAAALSLWSWCVAAMVYVVSVVLDGGVLGADDQAARLGNVSMGAMMAALGLGAVCVATTVVSHRPEGMGLARVPFLSWAALVGSVMWLVTLGSAFAHVIVGQVSRAGAAGLAENFTGGIAWLLRGPAVYVLAIPVLGVVIDVVAVRAGRRVGAYGVVQGLIGAYALLGFGAWAQLPGSVNTALWTLFALGIALPVLGLLGAVGDVLRRGPVRVDPALGLSVLALLLLLGSVAAGLLWALDLAGTGTLFGFNLGALADAQAAFVLGAGLAGGAAGLFHWSPHIWGAPAPRGRAATAGGLVVLGAAVLGTGLLVQALVQLDGKDTAARLFGAVAALGALLALFGVAGVLAASLGAARAAAEGDGGVGDTEGLTLEWSVPVPATGGVVPAERPPLQSPYPLLDARTDGGKEDR